ncbi:MAG: DEAD/DEAH box helicase [Phycisphaerales bacterium]|nr:DEAD/DEAH box helicase [Phycisphaerales bacterium]
MAGIHLHAIWRGGRLHLWGEQDAPTDAPRAALDDAQAHPEALATQALHAAMGDLSADGLLASIAADASLMLWLPARAGVPLHSTDDIVTTADDDHAVDLQAFRVPTLALSPADAIDFLTSLPEPLPRECAASVAYWARLANYVLALLARRQFVPDLEHSGSSASRAFWRSVVQDGAERDWLQDMSAAMPPVCRAVVARTSADRDAVDLVEDFLHSCTDAVVRRFLQEDPFFHQIHERAAGDATWEVRWLAALMSEDARIPSPPADLADFVNQLRGWIGRIDGDDAIPTRVCFRLREPEDEFDDEDEVEPVASVPQSPWHVEILLQLLDGAGTLQEIGPIWEDRGASPGVLRRNLANRHEHLVAELSRAAEAFPQLTAALHDGAPTNVELSVAEAHTFLRDSAPLLEARGFGVILPEWATQPTRRLGLRLHVRPVRGTSAESPGSGRLGLASLVDFEWRAAVGDSNVALEEFERIRQQRSPLVKLQGEWIALDADAIDAAVEFLQEQRSGRMTLGQAIRATAGAEDLDVGLPVVGIEGSAWIGRLLRDAEGTQIERVDQPGAFEGTMRPYQLRGLEWLAFMQRVGIGACLADDMGLGKTIQLIALLLQEQQRGDAQGPTLIFAPMTVVGNWRREIERFAPQMRVLVHHGAERFTGDAFVEATANHDIVITTYALGHRDQEMLTRVRWHRLVLDEAQKIKNPAAAQTIAIRGIPSTYRVALTGTPLENHLSELWSIMEMLNPGLLGSAARFRKRYAVPIERLGDRQRAEQLRGLIKPFVLRRIKDDPDVSCDLPEKMEMQVYCNLTPEQASLYEQVVEAALGEVEAATGIRRRGVILAALTRLKQICNHPVQYLRDATPLDGRSGKCERLAEMLEEVIAEDHAALVFTQFREMGDLLVRLLTERLHTEVLFLHGATTAKARQKMIDRFQDPDSGVRVFLLSLRAGGLGLNLTAANHVFHFDRWWNPAVEAQATDRAYRIGQTRRVQVHKFVCMGTIEDRIDRMLTEKLALADQIVGSGDEWLTGLSTEELRSCLRLSRDAVGEV